MTKALLVAASSIVSMIESSVTSAMTVIDSGFPGRFAQADTGLLGSASMIVTVAPRSASSVASSTAEVDFPAPPLGLAKMIVGMWFPQSAVPDTRRISDRQPASESYSVAIGYLVIG